MGTFLKKKNLFQFTSIHNGVASTLKSYAHQGETTGTRSDSLQLKMGMSLNEKKLLPMGAYGVLSQ